MSKRIQSNLLQQNCYVRDVSLSSDLKLGTPSMNFVSLDETVSSNGVEIKYNDYPYFITPEYVDSFSDSADYRLDPLGVINNSTPRQNLGDVRGTQDLMKLDDIAARALYNQLSLRFSAKSSAENAATTNNNDSVGGALNE